MFHDLRHTYNTNLRKAGVDQGTIMKLTGHKTVEMFHRYDTIDQMDAKLAVRKYESYLKTVESDCVNTASHPQFPTGTKK